MEFVLFPDGKTNRTHKYIFERIETLRCKSSRFLSVRSTGTIEIRCRTFEKTQFQRENTCNEPVKHAHRRHGNRRRNRLRVLVTFVHRFKSNMAPKASRAAFGGPRTVHYRVKNALSEMVHACYVRHVSGIFDRLQRAPLERIGYDTTDTSRT